MITLRPYQVDMLARARVALRTHKSVLIQAPTGAGKTALAASMIGTAAMEKNIASAFICHRQELLDQTAETFEKVGIDYGFCAAGRPFNPYKPVLICSIGTLINRMDRIGPRGFLIWDEAHHTAATTWAKVRANYGDAFNVGLTATPERLDGKGLEQQFAAIVPGPSVLWLIENGFLSKYRGFAPTKPNLAGVHTRGGDYAVDELEHVMDQKLIIGDAIKHYRRHADGKRAVVFCVTVTHAEHTAELFRDAGIVAICLHAGTPKDERRLAVQAFRDGQVKVLCNVNLFSEGFDLPAMEAVILLRPTKSLGMYMQQVGRSLRPYPGKAAAIILDHAGNMAQHGLPDDEREWSLKGRKKKKKKGDEPVIPIRNCPECFAAHRPAPVCPECGHVYTVQGRALEEVDGDLTEIDPRLIREKRLREQGAAKSLPELIALGRSRGYRYPEKWAAHTWTARMARRV
ncbi:MAG TPA: DEAD/DEAH box helicase [Bryobacteraceae bacterium]|nr:DEAD/DEAH box helicase [Bryobacteraceae bacterium]